jgi:hypothetical protein
MGTAQGSAEVKSARKGALIHGQTAESGVGTIHSSQGNLDRSCVAALGRAKARFTGAGRRHALICLLVSAIIALIGTDAFSNPAHKQAASHRPTAAKADNHKHRLATDASHWHKAAKADHHEHQSPTEAKHSERAPGPRILRPRNPSGSAALSDPPPMPQPRPPVLFAAVSPTDPVQNAARPAVSSEALDACPEPDVCIDQYLWSLYERTPKVDTVKVEERIKMKVKNKGKTRTVVKTLTKYITEDFGWKDPKAAQKAGMSLKDYVIGGMDQEFRRKLYNALRAMDDAGLSPGITSGFRDDYRQELANGNKAAPDSSYHGGSRRGGYGYGLAADLVSVKGETRAERCTWSEILWKWIDAHEKELGIGRPYLDKDPPHVAPIDGKEYADKRSAAKARLAGPHVAPIDGKEHADKRNAAKARLAGPHVAPIDGKEHADKRNAAKARLAGPHVAPIDGKEHADKRSAAKARLAGPHVAPIDGKEHADKRNAAKARLAGLKKPSASSNPK